MPATIGIIAPPNTPTGTLDEGAGAEVLFAGTDVCVPVAVVLPETGLGPPVDDNADGPAVTVTVPTTVAEVVGVTVVVGVGSGVGLADTAAGVGVLTTGVDVGVDGVGVDGAGVGVAVAGLDVGVAAGVAVGVADGGRTRS